MVGILLAMIPCLVSVIALASNDPVPSCATGDAESLSLLQAQGTHSRYEPPQSKSLGDSLPCKELRGVPIYILSLDRRMDRFHSLSDLLHGTWLGQQACRVRAVDAHNFSARLDPSLVHEDLWNSVYKLQGTSVNEQGPGVHRVAYKKQSQTPGSIALRMGHALMWEHALQQNADAPFAIFMEDDVNWFHPQFNEVVCSIAQGREPTTGWEWIQLQNKEGQDKFSSAQPEIVAKTHFHLAMYAMTRDAANKSLHNAFPIDTQSMRLDAPKGILRGSLKGFRASPPVANAPDSKYNSDVQKTALIQSVDLISDCQDLNATAMFYPQLLVYQPL
eukprot:TRINITY_DN7278_c0_g2_i1.p1 TRINITY_DN7278_c0_g2~~TRINITY_DN7278_c0_g2_i1.p1  ORF type:complete len:332 (+),score=40.16 TRINITY_DN7278_c0_g2_i1:55-1050(+)